MNFTTTVKMARFAAIIAASVAAVGATMGFYEMTENIVISGLFGVGIASLLGIGWHLTISAAENTRRNTNRIALVAVGVMLVSVAIATSGWSLVTAIGGKQALASYQQSVLQDHEIALAASYSRVNAQADLVDYVSQHATATGLLADEEGTSGKGPLYRSLMRTKDNLNGAAGSMNATIEAGESYYLIGLSNLEAGADNMGDDVLFRENMAAVQSSIASLNSIDVTGDVLSMGMVGLNDKGLPELSNLTADLRTAAEGAESEAVAIPHFNNVNRSEAVMLNPPIGAWIAAIAIDAAPFIFLLLVLLLANEPLLRDMANPKPIKYKTDDEIRNSEDNVVGINKAVK